MDVVRESVGESSDVNLSNIESFEVIGMVSSATERLGMIYQPLLANRSSLRQHNGNGSRTILSE